MPMIMPLLAWLSAVSLFTISPPSCTHVICFTLTKPVSVSTSTSANCTPAVPLEENPCCHSRCRERIHAKLSTCRAPIRPTRVCHTGLLLQLLQRFRTCVVNRRRNGSSGSAATAAPGRWITCIANVNRNLFGLESENVGRDDRDQSLRARSQVLRAAAYFDAAIRIDLRLGMSTFSAATPLRTRASDPGLDAAG